jgi:hypothetical protein
MVGDGHAMGVAAQITEHVLWASEGRFRVDHPVLSKQWSEPRSKGFWLSEELQVSVKVELAVVKGALERFVELAAKYATEYIKPAILLNRKIQSHGGSPARHRIRNGNGQLSRFR